MPPRPHKNRPNDPAISGPASPNGAAGQPAASEEEREQERIMAEMIRKMLSGQLD